MSGCALLRLDLRCARPCGPRVTNLRHARRVCLSDHATQDRQGAAHQGYLKHNRKEIRHR